MFLVVFKSEFHQKTVLPFNSRYSSLGFVEHMAAVDYLYSAAQHALDDTVMRLHCTSSGTYCEAEGSPFADDKGNEFDELSDIILVDSWIPGRIIASSPNCQSYKPQAIDTISWNMEDAVNSTLAKSPPDILGWCV